MSEQIKTICILGPTASGKTDLALHLAKKFNGEIINVDSAQVYKYMDIGTAKLDKNSRKSIPHHLFDIREPFDSYSASDFVNDASNLIHAIHKRGKLPILAGGTMLYFKALFDGLAVLPAADENYRNELEMRAEASGWEAIHKELCLIDAASAKRIKPGDSQRIQRAMEVFHITGKPLSVLHSEQRMKPTLFNFLRIALIPANREILHQQIERRFHQMMDDNFLQEVMQLIDLPNFKRSKPAMRAVGYRQLLGHLLDNESVSEAVQKGIFASRQLAKRQMTWLRKFPDLNRINAYSNTVNEDVGKLVEGFLINEM